MEKKRNWGVLFLIVSLLITTTGCGYKDIDKRYFVLNIGVDKGKDKEKYTIFIKIANPSEQGKIQSNDSEVLSIQSNSLSEGLELLKTRLDKGVDLGHMKVLLVSPYIAKHDMANVTNWIIQHRDIQRIAYVAIAKPNCQTILNVNPKTEKLPSGSLILTFGDTGTTSPFVNTEFLFDFYRDLNEKGKTAVLPIIEVVDNRIQVQRVGVFKSTNLVGELTPKETELLNAFIDQGNSYNMKYVIDNTVASLKSVRPKLHLHATGPSPYLEVDVKARGTVNTGLNNSSYSDIEKREERINQGLKKDIASLIKDLQKKNVDPIGLGLLYRSRHFYHAADSQAWKVLYPNLKVKVNVNTIFEGTGITK